jgi:DNA-binding XRE family transcriptional regulator
MTVGEKIKMLRQRSGLSQAQLAEALSVSRAAIAKWENDNGLPDISNLKALAEYMQVDLDELLDETKELAKPAPIKPPSESFCGKACSKCNYRDKIACKGCKDGPGKQYSGQCQVAFCCRNNHLSSCEECTGKKGCSKLNNEPLNRKIKMDASLEREELICKRASLLGKWLWICFWLVIPALIGDILSQDFIVGSIPWLYLPGQILVIAGNLCVILFLLRLSSLTELFQKAGRWLLVGTILYVLAMIFGRDGENIFWSLLNIPINFIILVGNYNKFCAYSQVLYKIDNEMSGKWDLFKKWYCWIHGAFWISILLLLFLIPLALLILFAAAVGVAILGIVEFVMLYHTAKLFRGFVQDDTKIIR